MSSFSELPRKPLVWVSGSKRSLNDLPEDVKDVFGAALLDVQYGDTPAGAKPFGEGLPHEIWKIVEDHGGDTYRAVYTATAGGSDGDEDKARKGVGSYGDGTRQRECLPGSGAA